MRLELLTPLYIAIVLARINLELVMYLSYSQTGKYITSKFGASCEQFTIITALICVYFFDTEVEIFPWFLKVGGLIVIASQIEVVWKTFQMLKK